MKYTVIIENTVKYTVTLREYSEIHQDPRNTEKNMKTLREYREYCESLEVPHENTHPPYEPGHEAAPAHHLSKQDDYETALQ